jgi:hypothetical protein
MLQFLQPTLNMLLRMIGDGGETLQVGGAHRGALSIVLCELIFVFHISYPNCSVSCGLCSNNCTFYLPIVC